MQEEDLNNRFSFHSADTHNKQKSNEDIRRQIYILALYLNDLLPEGREKSLAITKLEEVMFWSHAAIAREEEYIPEHTSEQEQDERGPLP